MYLIIRCYLFHKSKISSTYVKPLGSVNSANNFFFSHCKNRFYNTIPVFHICHMVHCLNLLVHITICPSLFFTLLNTQNKFSRNILRAAMDGDRYHKIYKRFWRRITTKALLYSYFPYCTLRLIVLFWFPLFTILWHGFWIMMHA